MRILPVLVRNLVFFTLHAHVYYSVYSICIFGVICSFYFLLSKFRRPCEQNKKGVTLAKQNQHGNHYQVNFSKILQPEAISNDFPVLSRSTSFATTRRQLSVQLSKKTVKIQYKIYRLEQTIVEKLRLYKHRFGTRILFKFMGGRKLENKLLFHSTQRI